MLTTPISRYHSLTIALHWLMALAIVFMLCSGLYMVNADLPKADQYQWYQLHKSTGVLVLFGVIARIAIRLFTSQPALPGSLTSRDRKLAQWGHTALYAMMCILPLSGWLMVSSSPYGLPTIVFDWFQWPHIPGVQRNAGVESIAKATHWYTGLFLMAMLTLHIGAVIKHKRSENLNLLSRMWWSK